MPAASGQLSASGLRASQQGAPLRAPFTSWAPTGPDGLFETALVRDLFQVLDGIDASAEVG